MRISPFLPDTSGRSQQLQPKAGLFHGRRRLRARRLSRPEVAATGFCRLRGHSRRNGHGRIVRTTRLSIRIYDDHVIDLYQLIRALYLIALRYGKKIKDRVTLKQVRLPGKFNWLGREGSNLRIAESKSAIREGARKRNPTD